MAAPCFVRGLDYIANNFGRNERANGIVHQHDVVRIGRRAGAALGHRVLAMLAAFDHLQSLAQDFRILLFDLGAKACDFVLAESDDDFVDGRSGGELAQRVHKNGHAAQFLELFGGRFWSRPRAEPCACRVRPPE